MSGKSYMDRFAEHLASLSYKKLPNNVIEKAKKCVLDHIGASIAAIDEEEAKLYSRLIEMLGESNKCTVMGSGYKTSCTNAAFLNAVLGGLLELNDTHVFTKSHPGQTIVSSAISMAEQEKVDGKKLISAVVAGYDTSLRIGNAVMPFHMHKGWQPSGTLNAFGATAAVGNILGLNANQMGDALSFAGHQAAGMFFGRSQSDLILHPNEIPLRPVAPSPLFNYCFVAGKAAMNGILSAILAKMGPIYPQVLEGRPSFFSLYADLYYPWKVTEDLGKNFAILEVGHKAQSCCRFIHAAIDASLELIPKYELNKDEVDSITVEGYSAIMNENNPDPPGVSSTRFSTQFQLAIAFVEGTDGFKNILMDPTNYSEMKLRDPEIRKFMKKTVFRYDSTLEKKALTTWCNVITVNTKDGKNYKKAVDLPKGEPQNPMSMGEIQEKFVLLATRVVGEKKVEKILDLVENLEDLEDVSELTELTYP